MAYTMNNLILDVLPRVGRIEGGAGITIWQAANSIQSLLFKKLLERRSDLLATGELFLVIPAYDYRIPLPSDFVSLVEKPRGVEAPLWLTSTVWMAGTVISYDSGTKTLVLNVTASNGSGSLSSWRINIGVLPGQPVYEVDTSASAVIVGIGEKTFITATALSLVPGQNVIVSNQALPTDSTVLSRMQPQGLEEDEHESGIWWESEYRFYGHTWEVAATKPSKYRIVGTNFYIRPKVTAPVLISGKYNAKPSALATVTDILPWNGFFDEIFREGVVRIITQGISIPDANPDFALFLQREFDTIINSRIHIIPSIGRLKRSNWL